MHENNTTFKIITSYSLFTQVVEVAVAVDHWFFRSISLNWSNMCKNTEK